MVSSACGYANYVSESDAGVCIDHPENVEEFRGLLIQQLQANVLSQQSQRALDYAETHDLYSMPEQAAQLIEQLAQEKVRKIK